MINRTIVRRVKKFESRAAPRLKAPEFLIKFIETGSETVVSTLRLANGRQEWWYAPGHEPQDADRKSGITGREHAQMSSDVLR